MAACNAFLTHGLCREKLAGNMSINQMIPIHSPDGSTIQLGIPISMGINLGECSIHVTERISCTFSEIVSTKINALREVLCTLRSKSLTWNIYTFSSGCNVLTFHVLYVYIHANSEWLTIISNDS